MFIAALLQIDRADSFQEWGRTGGHLPVSENLAPSHLNNLYIPIFMQPLLRHCGYLYREVTNRMGALLSGEVNSTNKQV